MAVKKPVINAVKKHLKQDNKDCAKETKEHNVLVKKLSNSKKKK